MKRLFLLGSIAFWTAQLMSATISSQCGFFTGNNFSQYKCPEKAGMESTLMSLNPSNGDAVCSYKGPNGEHTAITLHTECKVPQYGTDGKRVQLPDSMIGQSASSLATGITDKTGIDSSEDLFSTVDLRQKLQQVKSSLSGQQSFDAIASGLDPINSHSEYDKTVPSIITGVLTLDSDYFEQIGGKTRYINEVGEIAINPEKITVTRNSSWTGRVWDNIKGLWSGESSATGTSSYHTFNPMKFMDQQVLGYYVYLAENLLAGYMKIVYIIFMSGAMWGGGYYAYKKFFSKSTKEDDFKVNKMTYLVTASMGFIFFTAPLVSTPIEKTGAIEKAIYKDSSGSDSSTGYGYSTLAQQTVRYAAQTATYFGNTESDYAMKAFLALIQFKQGMLEDPTNAINAIDERLKVLETKIVEAGFASNYLENVCKPYFNGVDIFKISQSQSESLNMTGKTPDSDTVLSNAGISADRLNIDSCLEQNQKMSDIASSVISTKKSINQEIDVYKKMYNNTSSSFGGSSSEQRTFYNFMQMMIWTQNNFGWMASVTPHSSYLFFKNIGVFEYQSGLLDESDSDRSENFSQAMDDYSSQQGEKAGKVSLAPVSMVEGVSSFMVGMVVNNSTWFIVPGFKGVYDFFKSNLQEISFKGQTGEFTPMASRLSNMKDSLTGVIGKIPVIGQIFGGIGKFITVVMGVDDYIQFQILITFLSFFLAMWVVTTMIATVTVLSVTVFLTFKIVMFYVELIIFFMTAPVVGIYTTIMSAEPQQYLKNFATHLGMVIITPIMIVSASYIVLPISEFFKGLFSALVTLIFKVFDKGGEDLNQDIVGTNILDALTKQTALASMQGVAEIFAMISTIIISYIIIFNYREWFTKLIGLQGVLDHTRSAYSEMKEKSDKYVSPM
ncbi:MAG: hypothetical protein PHT07_10685 [Paludibacter sp.]|nr:hypothetical protein [Paludibacter sp.]